jgi:hypothetical protein
VDQQAVRDHAQAHCDALLAGDIERAAAELSNELRSNMGQFVVLLPLPLKEATIESVEPGGSGYVAILHLVGESDDVRLQTRWKDRDGEPRIVEASHISAPEVEAIPEAETGEPESGG